MKILQLSEKEHTVLISAMQEMANMVDSCPEALGEAYQNDPENATKEFWTLFEKIETL